MVQKFYDLLEKINIKKSKDKVAHAVIIMAIGYAATHLFGDMLAAVVVILVSIGKELYDKFFNGTVDFFDTFVTLLSGMLTIVFVGGIIDVCPVHEVHISNTVFIAAIAIFYLLTWYLFAKERAQKSS
ncbi:MAG: hypothetical protein ABXS91_10525 [Sulfurimonas sp.]